MTEYWVSKKQYWCKYCNIWIRDDAPSRKHHETGLKHIGQRERYIRDLYKSGNQAKQNKAEEAAELAKIEAAALRSGDTATRLTVLESLRAKRSALEHRAREASKPKDAFANYSSAKDLGFADDSTATEEESYAVEQELKGRAADPGAWEEVTYEPTGLYTAVDENGAGPSGTGTGTGTGSGTVLEKRKLGQYDIKDDDNHEDFQIRRKKRDPYDEDDWDPRAAIKGKARLGVKTGEQRRMEEHVKATNLDRSAWTGKLELGDVGRAGMVYVKGGGWVKAEGVDGEEEEIRAGGGEVGQVEQGEAEAERTQDETADGKAEEKGIAEAQHDKKQPDPTIKTEMEDRKPDLEAVAVAVKEAEGTATTSGHMSDPIKSEPSADAGTAGTGLFKKRRPPPSSRKK